MGNSQASDLATDKTCVGAYRYNPCWFCGEGGVLNTIFCCGRLVWDEGAGFALVLNDGIPLKTKEYPAWEKGTSLRNDFEQAILGEKMREVLLEAERHSVGAMRIDKLAPHLNKNFCPEINENLLVRTVPAARRSIGTLIQEIMARGADRSPTNTLL